MKAFHRQLGVPPMPQHAIPGTAKHAASASGALQNWIGVPPMDACTAPTGVSGKRSATPRAASQHSAEKKAHCGPPTLATLAALHGSDTLSISCSGDVGAKLVFTYEAE